MHFDFKFADYILYFDGRTSFQGIFYDSSFE